MKKSVLLLIYGIILSGIHAQAPEGISYQAVIRNASNELVTNTTNGIQVSIIQGTPEGTVVYSETHLPVSNLNGLVSFVIGQGNIVSGVFTEIDWAIGPYFIKTEADPAGGTNYTISGTSQILSVPYAFYSATTGDTSKWQKNLNGDLFYNDGNVGIGISNPSAKLHIETPVFSAKLATNNNGVFGEHSISGSYGYLGASNEGGFGYSLNGWGLRGISQNGYAIYGLNTFSGDYGWIGALSEGVYGYSASGYGIKGQTTNGIAVYGNHSESDNLGYIGSPSEGVYGRSVDGYGVRGLTTSGFAIYGWTLGSGYAGYFEGKAYVGGNMGIGEISPTHKLYISDLQTGLAYPLKIENKHTIVNEAAVGILFSTGGSGTTDRGKGGLVYEYTSTWNRGSFHFLQNSEANANNPVLANTVMTITNDGNVTIPKGILSVAANAGPNLIIHDPNAGPDRPGIQFTNNNIHYISGDDGSDEQFGFYSNYGNNRIYDATVAIFGKATSSWGKYLGLTHNGTSGRIFTDVGDLLLQPAGGVAINTTSAGTYKLNVNGNAYVSGEIKTETKTGYLSIPPAAFVASGPYDYTNIGDELWENELLLPTVMFFAPVNLPDNVIVVEVITYWQDNSTDAGVLRLDRTKLTDGNWNTLSFHVTNWQSSVRTSITDTTIDTPIIDNANYIYLLFAFLTDGPNIKFYGARIKYTYDTIN
ncbi:MAG: hypothetical protein IH597_16585 [Bacteroidales bacterium]|nr:hypothetical protein [Bacteroidales bacterium]